MGLDAACLTCRELNYIDPEEWDVQRLLKTARHIVARDADKKSEERLALVNIHQAGQGNEEATKRVNLMLADLNKVSAMRMEE